MNNPHAARIGRVALAVSAGGVLVRHPLCREEFPHAYSDVTNTEADNQKIYLRTRRQQYATKRSNRA